MTKSVEPPGRDFLTALVPSGAGGWTNTSRRLELLYDMACLAFETDSTRVITLLLDGLNTPAIEFGDFRATDSYHNLSHHGLSEAKLAQLRTIEDRQLQLLGGLFGKLKARPEGDGSLFDRTMVLMGTNLGDANRHTTVNLPLLLAGGGFRHGQHLMFDNDFNQPLANIFVSMLHRMGIQADRFASSTGTMRGLDTV